MVISTEVRIKIDNNQLNLKKIILVLDDGKIVEVDKSEVMINKNDYDEIFYLNLRNKNLHSFRQILYFFEIYKNEIFNCKRLKINISWNKFDNIEFIKIVDYLYNYKEKISFLDFSGNLVSKKGFEKVFELVEECPNFENMLGNNNFLNIKIFCNCLKKTNLSDKKKEKLNYNNFT